MTIELAPGLRYVPGFLDRDAQTALLGELRAVLREAPLFQPTMPRNGIPLSVRMSNCGLFGWTSDRDGYRYTAVHPTRGTAWPPMPSLVRQAWHELSGYGFEPEACLVNYYAAGARMGLHQDRDEQAFEAPVMSLSLGDTALFRYGGVERRGPTKSIKLESGDAVVLGGAARLAYHGVDRIIAGSSTLLAEGGRFNLTVRRVSGQPRPEVEVNGVTAVPTRPSLTKSSRLSRSGKV